MFEFKAKDLKPGDVFTTLEDQGSAWFYVFQTKVADGRFQAEVAEYGTTNTDTEWVDFGWSERVIVR